MKQSKKLKRYYLESGINFSLFKIINLNKGDLLTKTKQNPTIMVNKYLY